MSGPILLVIRIATAAALYAFLGWGLWLLWRDLRRHSRELGAPLNPPLMLTVEGEIQPATYRFTTPEVTIGRDSTCECSLDEPTISARHARLSYHHAQWWVEDLHSRNGSFLNDEPVRGQVVITSGDSLRCGSVVLVVAIELEETGHKLL
jgi:pSer/pThr/pTyr-binding forkhead associated (FHA) protein